MNDDKKNGYSVEMRTINEYNSDIRGTDVCERKREEVYHETECCYRDSGF